MQTKKFASLLVVAGASLWAADFWQSKPFTEWSDKEAQKMETNSPWSKEIAVSVGGGGGGGSDTGRGKKGGGGGGGNPDSPQNSGGQGGQVGDLTSGAGGGNSRILVLSWRTALPVREAVANSKYHAEAATSPDAKKLIDEEPKYYGILLTGLPGVLGGDKMKDAMLKNTTLNVKGKDPIQVTDVKTGGDERKPVVLFLFPRTAPLSMDDKEVEFSTKLGPFVLRQRFHLKDMVFNGKLEL